MHKPPCAMHKVALHLDRAFISGQGSNILTNNHLALTLRSGELWLARTVSWILISDHGIVNSSHANCQPVIDATCIAGQHSAGSCCQLCWSSWQRYFCQHSWHQLQVLCAIHSSISECWGGLTVPVGGGGSERSGEWPGRGMTVPRGF